MAPETKNWVRKYWQMVLLGFTLQVIAGLVIGIGSIRIGLRQINQNTDDIEVLGQSAFELQMNQRYIATEEELNLPYLHTNTN